MPSTTATTRTTTSAADDANKGQPAPAAPEATPAAAPTPGPARPTRRRTTGPKPTWPYPDLVVLTAHPCGQWCKRYTWPDGSSALRYFGPWSDPGGALASWRRRDQAIRERREHELDHATLPARLTIRALCSAYLDHARRRVNVASGITPSMYRSERFAVGVLLRAVDPGTEATRLGPREFAAVLASVGHRSPSTARHAIGGIRRLFKWAHADHALPLPTFGSAFRAPSLREFRAASRRRRDAVPIYSAAEIRALLAAAGPTLRAAIYMGINGGFGSSDLAAVPVSALQRGERDTCPTGQWARLSYNRAKTETPRALVLWPETAAALDAARPPERPARAADPLLCSRAGTPIVRLSAVGARPGSDTKAKRDRDARKLPPATTGCRTDLIARQFKRVLEATGMRGHFYLLRHTHATMAELLGDSETRRLIMGHTPAHALDHVYVARHGWHRVERTCAALRRWLFNVEESEERGPWCGVLPPIPPAWAHHPGKRIAPLDAREAARWRTRLGVPEAE